jgi:hypothetical protein
MKKIPKFIKILFVILALGFILLLIRSPEDDWICQNGSWVKHGNPSAQAPSVPCK